MPVAYDQVLNALRHVVDPELGVNIVDLGLVYDVTVADEHVLVTMTMTTPACPLGSYLVDEVAFVVQQIEGVKTVDVQLVWDPLWNPMMMSARARQQLGWRDRS